MIKNSWKNNFQTLAHCLPYLSVDPNAVEPNEWMNEWLKDNFSDIQDCNPSRENESPESIKMKNKIFKKKIIRKNQNQKGSLINPQLIINLIN